MPTPQTIDITQPINAPAAHVWGLISAVAGHATPGIFPVTDRQVTTHGVVQTIQFGSSHTIKILTDRVDHETMTVHSRQLGRSPLVASYAATITVREATPETSLALMHTEFTAPSNTAAITGMIRQTMALAMTTLKAKAEQP